ncbi:MAG TPA: glutaredoxin family protein [Mariprofundaceae bacterium]|nr:glutaredoxin family protein [Mariprofundaceae bacterium]
MPVLPLLQMMTRQGCSLCDDVYIAGDLAQREGLCRFESVDVDADEILKAKYGLDVPVLLIDGVEHARHFVEYPKLMVALRAAQGKNNE